MAVGTIYRDKEGRIERPTLEGYLPGSKRLLVKDECVGWISHLRHLVQPHAIA